MTTLDTTNNSLSSTSSSVVVKNSVKTSVPSVTTSLHTSSSSSASWRRDPTSNPPPFCSALRPNQYKSFHTRKRNLTANLNVARTNAAQSSNIMSRVGKPQRTVCGACIVTPTHVLLVQQREVDKWGFPKGSREWQESKFECMKRELTEETGIVLTDHSFTFLGKKTCFKNTIFFYEMTNELEVCPKDTQEIVKAQWVSWEELTKLPLNRITNHIRKTLLSKPTWKTILHQHQTPKKNRSIH